MTKNIVNPRHVGYTGSLRASGDEAGDAWFTPKEIIDLARQIMGEIDLDPFSSEEANNVVRARRIFTLNNSAFDQNTWKAKTVFMNPPYSRGLCSKAVGRLLHEFRAKAFQCGIVLVNNMTDTAWFHALAWAAQRRCDFRGRISFVTADNKRISGNTRGQTLFLLAGDHHPKAIKMFDAKMPEHGLVYRKPVRGVVSNDKASRNYSRVYGQAGGGNSRAFSPKFRLYPDRREASKISATLGG